MTEQELREKMTIAMGQCYSQELSACPSHPIFQPQKAINLMLVLIKEKYVRLADDQSYPPIPRQDIVHIIMERDTMLREAGFRKVEL